MKFSEIVQKLESAASNSLIYNTDCDPEIGGIAPIDEAKSSTLSYIEGAKFATWVGKTAAAALILPLDEALQAQATARGIAWISASEPRLLFAQAIALFYKPWQPAPEIHPTAVIHPDAQLGEDVYIGPHVAIAPASMLMSPSIPTYRLAIAQFYTPTVPSTNAAKSVQIA